MRQPPSGAERSRSLGITELGMSLKQEREPSESLSGAKEKFWMSAAAAPTVALMLLWSKATEERQLWTWNSGKWEKEKGEEEKEREIKKRKKYLKAVRNCVKDTWGTFTQAEEQTIFVWFVLVLPVCFGLT